MGMDLIGLGRSYNLGGWDWMITHLKLWGVDVKELRYSNDGDPISRETCIAIADAIELHLDELNESERKWIQPHIVDWRACLGCLQF